ncbi:MAG: hypothetical protein CVT97_07250 [Bacteroidetes bacterium HGW-Bacteroidetes-14]|jgi:hypothetical protein|nr:MAG: hypothetical protein CVT97_07250 [Bacteroidetes bacterium HGW-Bacteroidetes-14]
MKDDNIKMFFNEHKQTIADEGFSSRLFATLDCLPEPKPKADKTPFVMVISITLGVILFGLFGGYSILFEGLSSVGVVFTNYKSATPEIIISVFFTLCSLFALGRYAIRDNS